MNSPVDHQNTGPQEQATANALKSKLAAQGRELQRLESALGALRTENMELVREREVVVKSRSWRLTAPLRWVAARMRWRQATASISTEGNGTSVPATSDATAEGLASLPEWLRSMQPDTLDASNATCKLVNLHPGLQGIVPEHVLHAMEGSVPTDSNGYLGWRPDPPVIGFIGSRELRVELAFDARVKDLDEGNWESALVGGAMRFLLVEAVWHVEHKHWRYALTREGDQSTFRRLLARCREISLPVVVWLRETPGNYSHFAWLADHADLVCVADPENAARMRREFPGIRVEYFPPAIQPALHNPLRSHGLMRMAEEFGDRILFDGWWDLQDGIDELPLLHGLRSHGLLIAESEWDFGKVRLNDRPDFKDYVIGCLDPLEKLALNRLQGAEVFASAPLAGSWRNDLRMVRAAASGSLVARLDGMPLPLQELYPLVAGADSLGTLLAVVADPVKRAQQTHLAWRGLMSAHTIAHRLQAMADGLSIKVRFLPQDPRVACLLATKRPELLRNCIERFRNDLYSNKELIVVVHDDDTGLGELRKLANADEPIRFFQAGRSLGLGACLNFAAAQTEAPYWTKVDDDDLYGPEYLADMMLYQRTGSFDIFGKPPIFNYLESGDELTWDPLWARHANLVHEARDARAALVAGGTLGGRRHVLEAVPFCERRRGGSDSDFIRRAYEAGYDLQAADGFNFVRFRSRKPEVHTWRLDDDEVRRRTTRLGGYQDISSLVMI